MKFLRSAAGLAIRMVCVVISAVNKLMQMRCAATVFRVSCAILFIVMSIGLFPAAEKAPLSLPPADEPSHAEKQPEQQLYIPIIYRDNAGSEWALTAARHLAAELTDRYGCEAALIPASRYASEELPTEGAIVIGHTELSQYDYVASYYALGPDGWNTYFNSRGDLIIEAFGSAGAEAGIERFLSNYNGDAQNAVNKQNGMNMLDLDAALTNFANGTVLTPGTTPSIVLNSHGVASDSEDFKIMVLASPDDSSYTVRAIEALLDTEKPDMVVFCGDLSAGRTDRAALAKAWDAITAPINAREILWSFIPKGDGTCAGALPASMINEVVSARSGCAAIHSESSLITITDAAGFPMGGLWLVGDGADSEALRADLEKNSSLLYTAAGKAVPGVMISDGALDKSADMLNSNRPDGIRTEVVSKIAGVYEAATQAGISCFVSSEAPENTGYVSSDGVICAVAGSVGFEGAGLGGRFEYNNSLRGGTVLTLNYSNGSFEAKYVYTADLGVNHR